MFIVHEVKLLENDENAA